MTACPARHHGRIVRIVVLASLAGCATGARYHGEGMRLSAAGDHEAALAQLREANLQEPGNSRYRLDLLKEQAAYSRLLTTQADEARRAGRTEAASTLYTKASRVDPGNEQATRGLTALQMDSRHAKLVDEADRALKERRLADARSLLKAVLAENPAHAGATARMAALDEQQADADRENKARIASISALNRPVTLQFRDANLRMVFEALSRTTGLNVILDRDVRPDLKTTIFVKDATVEDTVDLILLQNQLLKRQLNANTLFVYPATSAKQKEYQDLQIRTFHVTNADVKYLQAVLKALLKMNDVSMDERSSTLVIRDTAEAIAVATKVIAAHDVPVAEVMLEVEVLEVSRDRLSNIGVQLPNAVTIGTPDTANTIGAVRNLTRNDLTITPLAVGINLRLEDTDANLLASPRIRASNKEKARILIGDRVPTIVNTVTPVSTGLPVITGTVQYQEVGLKLEFEPQVFSDLDVGNKINVEVSNIVKEFTDPQGGRSYQIGTRNAQTTLRLRHGETQILAGLITDQDRNIASKIPGLGHLPMVGKLFGNNNGTHNKSELVLSITPHILRGPATADAAFRDVYSGTENQVRERALQLDPIGEVRSQSSGSAEPVVPTRQTVRPAAAAAEAAPASAVQPSRPANAASAAPPATASSEPLLQQRRRRR
jgi:general secretion pathway protein D